MLLESIYFVKNMSLQTFIIVFWYYILFDFTRYIVSIVPTIFVLIYNKFASKYVKSIYDDVANKSDFTVLIAGHNEEKSLEKTVNSIHEQNRKPSEIIFIDDGSTDSTIQIAERLFAQGKINTFLSTGIRAGKSAALNFGLRFCKTEFFIISDVDTTFDRDAFDKILYHFKDRRVGAVAGNLGVRNAKASVVSRLQDIEYLEAISLGRYFSDIMDILPIVSGAFGAFRTRAVRTVGGLEVGPGEDADIVDKLRRSGWRIRFALRAWALTDVPETLTAFTRQRIRWNHSVIRIRFRKFGVNLNPFKRPFILSNALEIINILFFQVLLSATFFIYLGTLPILYGNMSLIIILSVLIFYVIEDFIFFIFVLFILKEREPMHLLLYLPLNSIFRAFVLRGIRLVAYVDELIFRRSYKDEYVPRRVLQHTERF